MSFATLTVFLLIALLIGGLSGRFGGYGYGYGHTGVALIGAVLLVVSATQLLGRI